MKLLHLADLHIGKKLFDLSLREDQEHILARILEIARDEAPDAILISGDVYDKAQASAEAVQMFDRFLTSLRTLDAEIFLIAGNHDSPARLGYGGRLLSNLKIHIAGELTGLPPVYTLTDAHGPVHFVLLPFFRLYEIRQLWPEQAEEIRTYNDAVALLLTLLNLPPEERCVLLAHQHFSSRLDPAETSDSELDIIGGLDAVSSELLQGFSYVALGHLHRPQKSLVPHIRYAGSPLAYSFSELNQQKAVPVIELGPFGSLPEIRQRELTPLRALRELTGTLEELIISAKALPETARQDFLRVTLTDKDRLENPMRRLQAWYPNVLILRVEREAAERSAEQATGDFESKSAIDLFRDFYREQRGLALAEADQQKLSGLWNELLEQAELEARK